MSSMRVWGTVAVAAIVGCGSVEYQQRSFEELSLEVRPGIRLTVNALGTWRQMPRDSGRIEVSGAPYTIDLRIQGPPQVTMEDFALIDSSVGDSLQVTEWDPPVRRGELTLFVNRSGIHLPARDQWVEGRLIIGSGETSDSIRFSGILGYRHKVERRSRLLEAIRGI